MAYFSPKAAISEADYFLSFFDKNILLSFLIC